MKIRTLAILVLLSGQFLCAQSFSRVSGSYSSDWIRRDIFKDNVFIENSGQFFENGLEKGVEIKYGINSNGIEAYFTSKGLTYKLYEKESSESIEKISTENILDQNEEAAERGKMKERRGKVYGLDMNWLNANPDVKIVAEDISADYFTYGFKENNKTVKAFGYKKLTYKDLYPGIDVEYVFHKTTGIKYSFILHPGADPSDIRMHYGNAKEVSLDRDGNIHINGLAGTIIDHAPQTYYSENGGMINSQFSVLDGNNVAFRLDGYDRSKAVVIDPWTANPAMTIANQAYDIARDAAGNVFIYGGGDGWQGPYQLKKYSSAGTLLWTFTPVQLGASYYGDFALDLNGNTYLCDGAWKGGIVKVDPSGNLVYFSSTGLVRDRTELWRIGFDCNYNNLIVGGYFDGTGGIGRVNPVTGAVTGIQPVGGTGTGRELRSLAVSFTGRIYSLHVDWLGVATAAGNVLAASTPAIAPIYNVGNGYLIAESAGMNYVQAAGSFQGFNGITVNNKFIMTYDGKTIYKRNINTGAAISSVTVSNGSVGNNSGIVIDGCGNVYVGTHDGVSKFDSTLNYVASVATADTVYDVALGISGEVLACGDGFVASIQFNVVNCQPLLTLSVNPTPLSCGAGNNGTATVSVAGGTGPYSFLWNPSGQTGQTATGLSPGIYTVAVTDVNGCNGGFNVTTVAIETSTGLTLTTTSINPACPGAPNGTAGVVVTGGTGPYTYLWSPSGQTGANATGIPPGTYTCSVTDNTGCTIRTTVVLVTKSSPTVNTASANISCTTSGRAYATIVGGTAPYYYTWNTGQTGTGTKIGILDGSELSNAVAGSYTLTISDNLGCVITKTFTITGSSPVSATFNVSTACVGTKVNFTNTGTPPGSGITYTWLISTIAPANVSGTTTNFSYTFLTAGTYSVVHTVKDGTCNNSVTQSIVVVNCNAPTVSAVGGSVCPGACATITSNGAGGTTPYTYTWSNSATTQNINPCPASTTTYTVTIKDAGGNTSTSTAVVTVNPSVTLTTSSGNITCNGSSNGTILASPGSGTVPYTYSWSNGQTTQTATGLIAGNYSVTITDSKGCSAMSMAAIISPSAVVGQIVKGTAGCTGCGCKQWIMVNAMGGTSPYSYSWLDGYVNRYKNQLCPGTYTINIKDKNGCSVNVNLSTP
ncbi:MAG: hypothetical protein HYU69_00445 [Bacteroidetes bacterium]|nr:hypothetical protein [Bacteroidota bacterium]